MQDAVVEVVREQTMLDALAGAWDALHARCPAATPFQTHAWVAAWARAYCPPGRLRVVVVRSGGELLAAAPLHLVRRGPWPVLTALGVPITDVTDILLAPSDGGTDAGRLLAEALLGLPGWCALDLPEVAPAAAMTAWAAAWRGRRLELESSVCAELLAAPLPDVLSGMPAKAARRIRNYLRRTDATGIELTIAADAEVPSAVTDLLRLHERQWRGRNGTPEHLRPRFARFLTEALCRMVPARQAVLTRYRLDGELVASEIDLVGPGVLGSYLSGVEPDLRRRVDVAGLLIRANLALAVDAGVPRLSMLRGEEPYKEQWHPEWVRHRRIILARPGNLAGAGYLAGVRAYRAAVEATKRRSPRTTAAAARLSGRLRRG